MREISEPCEYQCVCEVLELCGLSPTVSANEKVIMMVGLTLRLATSTDF